MSGVARFSAVVQGHLKLPTQTSIVWLAKKPQNFYAMILDCKKSQQNRIQLVTNLEEVFCFLTALPAAPLGGQSWHLTTDPLPGVLIQNQKSSPGGWHPDLPAGVRYFVAPIGLLYLTSVAPWQDCYLRQIREDTRVVMILLKMVL